MVGPFSPIQEQINYFFPPQTHPYELLQALIERHITKTSVVLELGCGRGAPNLRQLVGKAGELYGIDLVDVEADLDGITFYNCSADKLSPFADASVDIVFCRSVMEHLQNVDDVYAEIFRVLKAGGLFIFLTPNLYDYASVIAHLTPNRWHPFIVQKTEGRTEHDVFPTYYRSNSRGKISLLARGAGFEISTLDYLGQYPSYLSFSRPLFFAGCMYAKLIQNFSLLNFLQGWLLCVMQKPG